MAACLGSHSTRGSFRCRPPARTPPAASERGSRSPATLLTGGTGAVGAVLGRLATPPRVTAALCLLAPVAVVGLLLFDAVLPLSVRRLVVRTAGFLVPVGAAWITVGAFVWRRGRHRASGSE
ncbi:hypothetical protein ACFQL1_05935 [Halomicroarcula sp. GCM10025709]